MIPRGMLPLAMLGAWFLASSPAVVVAAPDAKVRARATEVGKEALAAYEEGRYDAAYGGFAEADRLLHSPVLVLYMARCRAKMGRLREARALLHQVIDEPVPAGAPKSWAAAHDDAKHELTALEATIPRLRIAAPEGTRVTLDGEAVEPGEHLVDPGRHRVVVRGDDGAEAMAEVEVREGEALDVAPSLGAPPEPDPSAPLIDPPKAVPAPVPLSEPKLQPVRDEPLYWPGGLLIGVGGAGVVVGSILGGLAWSNEATLEEQCQELRCAPDLEATKDRSLAFAHGSTATLAIGGAFAVAGLVLLLVPPVETKVGEVSVRGSSLSVSF